MRVIADPAHPADEKPTSLSEVIKESRMQRVAFAHEAEHIPYGVLIQDCPACQGVPPCSDNCEGCLYCDWA